MFCTALAIGYHIATAHDASPQYRLRANEANPGLYAQCDSVVIGAYYNTQRRASVYAGKAIRVAPSLELIVGGVTGYTYAPVTPMVMLSYRLSDGTRLSFIPTTPQNVGGLHLSKEF